MLYIIFPFLIGSILTYLSSSLSDGSDTTADVLIHCSNGIVPTHRLVLASISSMLLSIFKQDTWDETITLMLKDFTVDQISEYLLNFYQNGTRNSKFSEIDKFVETGLHNSDLSGPLSAPPFTRFQVSPLMTAPKKPDGR